MRGALTTEVWETQNQTWLEFKRMLAGDDSEPRPGGVLRVGEIPLPSVPRRHCRHDAAGRGFALPAAWHLLERADNTARLLDVRFQALSAGDDFGPGAAREAQEVDFYHWSAILRSVSGFEIYRKVYRNVIHPAKVAELLILRPDMPRSLAACMNEAVANLELVANEHSGETLRRAGRLQSDLRYGRIDEILATGLHAYLTQFLDRVNDLGVGISRDFLVPMAA